MTIAADSRERWIRLTTAFLIVAIIMTCMAVIDNFLLSIIIATVINYLLNPVANFLERTGLERKWAASLPFILFIAGFFLLGGFLVPLVVNQVTVFRNDYPIYIEQTMRYLTQFEVGLALWAGNLGFVDLNLQIRETLVQWTKTFAEDIPSILSSSITTVILAPFIAFFMILDGRRWSRMFLGIMPHSTFEMSLNLVHQINKQIGDFFRARVLEAVIVAAVVFTGLFLIDFPFAILLAVFAGLTNFIPYIGPIIGAVPALIVALANDVTAFEMTMVGVTYLIAQAIDAFVIIPIVVAKIVNLHPLLVIISFILGAELLGVVGMIISIPVAGALQVTGRAVFQHLIEFRP